MKPDLDEKSPATEEQAAPTEQPKADDPKAEKPAKVKKAAPPKTANHFKVGEQGILTKEQRKHVILVTDEGDPLYNPKLRNPEDLSDSLIRLGWKATNPLTVLPDGRIMSGRTKWHSLERAERKLGKAIDVPFVVIDMDEEEAADATDTLDIRVQKLDPMTIAEKIMRSLSRGKTEQEIFEFTRIKPEEQHGYLLLLDEECCPPEVQDLIRTGQVPLAAAIELARRAKTMTKAEVKQAAEQIVKATQGGLKVTSKQVKSAAGVDAANKPATLKERKQLILDLQSSKLAGKFGEQVKWAAIIAMEVGLGTRSKDSFWTAIDKIAKGNVPRIDFKQYQTDGKVKGQDDKE